MGANMGTQGNVNGDTVKGASLNGEVKQSTFMVTANAPITTDNVTKKVHHSRSQGFPGNPTSYRISVNPGGQLGNPEQSSDFGFPTSQLGNTECCPETGLLSETRF